MVSDKGMVARDLGQASRVVFGVFDLSVALLDFGLLLSVFASVLLYIVAGGLVLVGARMLFFLLIPALIAAADPIVVAINAFIVALDAFSAIVSVFILALSAGTDEVQPLNTQTISVDEYKAFLREVVAECSSYTSLGSIWERMLAPDISTTVCPYVRAVYPTTGNSLRGLQGFITADPDPYGNNCDTDTPPHFASVCVGLGAGYIVLEFLVPLLLICIFLYTSGRSVLRLLWVASELVLFLAFTAVEAVVVAGDSAERAILFPVTSMEG